MFEATETAEPLFGPAPTPGRPGRRSAASLLAASWAAERATADAASSASSVLGSSSVPVSAAVGALAAAVAPVLAQVPAELAGPQALADAAELLTIVERLRGAVLHRLADIDTRKLHTLDGSVSTGGWVARQQTSIDRSDVALAGRLAALPCVEQAVQAGALSVDTAARVGKALARLRPHLDRPDGLIDGQPAEQALTGVIVHGVHGLVCQALGGLAEDDPRVGQLLAELVKIAARPASELARLEAAFVLLAQQVESAQLPGALAQLVDALLPNELERRAQDGYRRRGFGIKLSEDGAGWRVTEGDLDLECGELLHTFLTAELAADQDPADTAGYEQLRAQGWQFGDPLPTSGAPRSLRQRRHDALKCGLRRYLDAGVTGMRDKIAPHIAVTVSADTLTAAPGGLPAVGASGARLPLSTVQRWWCEAAVGRFVLGLGRRVIEASHTERTLKAHERRAKHLETGGRCQGAGCNRGPGARLIPHHVTPWGTCRSTSLTDTVLLCESTHHDLHSGKHTIQLKDGRWLDEHGWRDGPSP